MLINSSETAKVWVKRQGSNCALMMHAMNKSNIACVHSCAIPLPGSSLSERNLDTLLLQTQSFEHRKVKVKDEKANEEKQTEKKLYKALSKCYLSLMSTALLLTQLQTMRQNRAKS